MFEKVKEAWQFGSPEKALFPFNHWTTGSDQGKNQLGNERTNINEQLMWRQVPKKKGKIGPEVSEKWEWQKNAKSNCKQCVRWWHTKPKENH